MNMEINNLAIHAFKEIPEAKPNAEKITALVKDSGKIVGYQLSNGNITTKEEAINLAKQGEIAGVGIAVNKGSEYLKSLPDITEENNLGSLPSISRS